MCSSSPSKCYSAVSTVSNTAQLPPLEIRLPALPRSWFIAEQTYRHPRLSHYRTPITTPLQPLERSPEARPNRARINPIRHWTRRHAPPKVSAPLSSVFPLPNSDHDTSAAIGKISRNSIQPRKNHLHRSPNALPRAAQSSGAVKPFFTHHVSPRQSLPRQQVPRQP